MLPKEPIFCWCFSSNKIKWNNEKCLLWQRYVCICIPFDRCCVIYGRTMIAWCIKRLQAAVDTHHVLRYNMRCIRLASWRKHKEGGHWTRENCISTPILIGRSTAKLFVSVSLLTRDALKTLALPITWHRSRSHIVSQATRLSPSSNEVEDSYSFTAISQLDDKVRFTQERVLLLLPRVVLRPRSLQPRGYRGRWIGQKVKLTTRLHQLSRLSMCEALTFTYLRTLFFLNFQRRRQ
jgi:hypothetical protein